MDVTRRDFLRCTAATGVIVLVAPPGSDKAPAEGTLSDLAAAFTEPPDSARPWALWFWMNGHVTREGITLDLEALKRVGLGGVLNFDAGTGIPKGPVEYLGPEWFELKRHAIREAERLGLEFGMHNCPGWSSSGGPWITPDLAMQQLTWSEAHIEGGTPVDVVLPAPFRKLDYYRRASGDSLGKAVRREHHPRGAARREPPGGEGHEPVAEPADRRPRTLRFWSRGSSVRS